MIAVPAASGFIPNESIVDSVAKLYSMFSRRGKEKQDADTDLARAQAANVRDIMAYRPSEDQRAWAGLDLQGELGRGNLENQSIDTASTARAREGQLELGKDRLGLESIQTQLDGIIKALGLGVENRRLDQNQPIVDANVGRIRAETGALEAETNPRTQSLKLLSDLFRLNPEMASNSDLLKQLNTALASEVLSKDPQFGNKFMNQTDERDRQRAQLQRDQGKPGTPDYEAAKQRYPDVFGVPPIGLPPLQEEMSITPPGGARIPIYRSQPPLGPTPNVQPTAPAVVQPQASNAVDQFLNTALRGAPVTQPPQPSAQMPVGAAADQRNPLFDVNGGLSELIDFLKGMPGGDMNLYQLGADKLPQKPSKSASTKKGGK